MKKEVDWQEAYQTMFTEALKASTEEALREYEVAMSELKNAEVLVNSARQKRTALTVKRQIAIASASVEGDLDVSVAMAAKISGEIQALDEVISNLEKALPERRSAVEQSQKLLGSGVAGALRQCEYDAQTALNQDLEPFVKRMSAFGAALPASIIELGLRLPPNSVPSIGLVPVTMKDFL